MECHCSAKNIYHAGWLMRYGSITPTREHRLVKKMLSQTLVKLESSFDGEIKERYLCQVCGTLWELTLDETRGGMGRGVKILTKIASS